MSESVAAELRATTIPRTASWLIVSQYKSDRVVYFTDDPAFEIPASAEWCYVSPYEGELPKDMTLRNCWSWRYRGMSFIDTRGAPVRPQAQALLDHNKEALRKLLRERIEVWRRPVLPSASGAGLRATKLAEARAVVAGHADPSALRLLPGVAAARRCTVLEMARQIIARHEHTEALLERSELLREELSAAIEQATTQTALSDIRARLLEELASEDEPLPALKPEHTTQEQMRKQPAAEELAQEQLRLQISLRLKINHLRRSCTSEYLLDEVVLRHKGRIAEAVVKAGGALPPGMDGTALISHAAARGQTLLAAAHEVLTEMSEVARVLLETEQLKDALLARAAAASTFAELQALDNTIHSLMLTPPRRQT